MGGGTAEGIGVNKLFFIGMNTRFCEWLSAQSQILKSAPDSGVMCVCLVSLLGLEIPQYAALLTLS